MSDLNSPAAWLLHLHRPDEHSIAYARRDIARENVHPSTLAKSHLVLAVETAHANRMEMVAGKAVPGNPFDWRTKPIEFPSELIAAVKEAMD
ncbi:MAG: hypothetical protein AAGG38_06255 [Planctomycetota bacterium]